jgi:hypothetical protein
MGGGGTARLQHPQPLKTEIFKNADFVDIIKSFT